MVSAGFKAIYQAEGLAGIRHFDPPAEIVRVGRRRTGDLPPSLPSYHLVHIERLGPELDEEASGMNRTRLGCPYCHRGDLEGWERIVIKPESWSGEDIFYPRGISGDIVVSQRFKDVIEANQLKNVWLILAEKWAYGREQPGYAPRAYVRED
jgi:hypothetical protein